MLRLRVPLMRPVVRRIVMLVRRGRAWLRPSSRLRRRCRRRNLSSKLVHRHDGGAPLRASTRSFLFLSLLLKWFAAFPSSRKQAGADNEVDYRWKVVSMVVVACPRPPPSQRNDWRLRGAAEKISDRYSFVPRTVLRDSRAAQPMMVVTVTTMMMIVPFAKHADERTLVFHRDPAKPSAYRRRHLME